MPAGAFIGSRKPVHADQLVLNERYFSFGWFEKGAPSGPGITAGNLASARLTDAGPR